MKFERRERRLTLNTAHCSPSIMLMSQQFVGCESCTWHCVYYDPHLDYAATQPGATSTSSMVRGGASLSAAAASGVAPARCLLRGSGMNRHRRPDQDFQIEARRDKGDLQHGAAVSTTVRAPPPSRCLLLHTANKCSGLSPVVVRPLRSFFQTGAVRDQGRRERGRRTLRP